MKTREALAAFRKQSSNAVGDVVETNPVLAERYASTASMEASYIELQKGQARISSPHARAASRIASKAASSFVDDSIPVIDKRTAALAADSVKANDAGMKALATHLKNAYLNDESGVLTVGDIRQLQAHWKKSFGKSASHEFLANGIVRSGFLNVDVKKLSKLASEIHTQADFDYAMREAGLVGSKPDQIKARTFVLALLNRKALSENCKSCKGSGQVSESCQDCEGTGVKKAAESSDLVQSLDGNPHEGAPADFSWMDCKDCGGAGCPNCKGTGKEARVAHTAQYKSWKGLAIPPGCEAPTGNIDPDILQMAKSIGLSTTGAESLQWVKDHPGEPNQDSFLNTMESWGVIVRDGAGYRVASRQAQSQTDPTMGNMPPVSAQGGSLTVDPTGMGDQTGAHDNKPVEVPLECTAGACSHGSPDECQEVAKNAAPIDLQASHYYDGSMARNPFIRDAGGMCPHCKVKHREKTVCPLWGRDVRLCQWGSSQYPNEGGRSLV
jgi:hypothetical protein